MLKRHIPSSWEYRDESRKNPYIGNIQASSWVKNTKCLKQMKGVCKREKDGVVVVGRGGVKQYKAVTVKQEVI